MGLAKTNTHTDAFITAHAVSALLLGPKVEHEGAKALMHDGVKAIHDLLASGDRGGQPAKTLDGGHVDVVQAVSAAPTAGAGFKHSAAAITRA